MNPTHTQLTQLKFVTRNGQADSAFYRSLQRQQAARTIKSALRASLKATGKTTWYILARVSDDINHTTKLVDEYHAYFGSVEAEAEQVLAERRRNAQGMFVAG